MAAIAMVEIVDCALVATVTDEQFDELLALAVSWHAYCIARRDLDHQEAMRALAPTGAAAPLRVATSA